MPRPCQRTLLARRHEWLVSVGVLGDSVRARSRDDCDPAFFLLFVVANPCLNMLPCLCYKRFSAHGRSRGGEGGFRQADGAFKRRAGSGIAIKFLGMPWDGYGPGRLAGARDSAHSSEHVVQVPAGTLSIRGRTNEASWSFCQNCGAKALRGFAPRPGS